MKGFFNRMQAAIAAAGALSLGMGIQAYFFPRPGHESSLISLAAAGGLGLLYIVSAIIAARLNLKGGYIMAAGASLFLLSRFGPKVVLGRAALYPDVVMALIAVALLTALTYLHFQQKRAKD